MKFSVIIPTHNEARHLPCCLAALASQSLPRDQYEIIVVDDGSTDQTAQIAENAGVRLIKQHNQGPAAARNRGAAEAKGEILLFTDADCEADRDWIAQMTAPLDDVGITGVRGLYRTRQHALAARFAQIEYEEKYRKLRRRDSIDFIDTSAAAYRKKVFLEQGGFRTDFRQASGEDTEFSFRLAGQGYRLVLNPEAIVYHFHPESFVSYFRRKFKTAFWRIFIYRRHPGKMTDDSHTPLALKLQIPVAAMLVIATLGIPFNAAFRLPVIGLAAVFLAIAAPFTVFAFSRDPLVGAISPAVLFVRSTIFALGLLMGVIGLCTGRAGNGETASC